MKTVRLRSLQAKLALRLAASPPNFDEVASKWPTGSDDPSYFHLKDFGGEGREYYGLTVVQSSMAGPLSVSVEKGPAGAAGPSE